MATMNKQQVEHLQKRLLSAIDKAKENFAKTIPKTKEFSKEDMVAAIKSGKAKLSPLIKFDHYTRFLEAYNYPEKEKIDAMNKKREEQIIKFAEPLYTEAKVIMDAAILGGAEQALEALKKFMLDLKV
jgi:hypothetical protein